MKRPLLSAILLLAVCAGADARGITLHAVQRPAEKVFSEIMSQSGKNFVYSAGLLDGINVTVSADGAPLRKVLDSMFAGTSIAWRIKGNNIMLYERPRQQRDRRYTVSGFVREAGNDEAVVGAVVSCPSCGVATTTNTMGFYSLSLPAGDVSVEVTYSGFKPYTSRTIALDADRQIDVALDENAEMLDELVVNGSRNRYLSMESSAVGNLNLSSSVIKSTPAIFGEADVIKALQLEPGVSAGVEGMAGMYVHGGEADQNLYMLDNIPVYQVNHFAGLFSAFNVDAVRNVDFYKSSFPARYDGRLSSFTDVHTKDGSVEGHHGSVKLGLTSGAFNIDGPISRKGTTYSVAVRRSWFDVLTVPAFAIANKFTKDETYSMGYAFMDANAKISHRFSDKSTAYAMFYYGDDYLKINQSFDNSADKRSYDKTDTSLRWGNIVASLGWRYVLSPKLFGELTGAFTRYQSRMGYDYEDGMRENGEVVSFSHDKLKYDNHINDWILKADFDYTPHPSHKVNFGVSYTFHSFLPARSSRTLTTESSFATVSDATASYHANEAGAYIGDDWTISPTVRANAGVHYTLFGIENKVHNALSPRAAVRWTFAPSWAVKASYGHTAQFVHQLLQSSISLPTDQWVPITASHKPQTADKIAAGVYFSPGNRYTFSVEGYYKWMHNLIEYAEEYYLLPPDDPWDTKMTSGRGTAKGIDFKVAKEFGKFTGHVAYSLMWADRCYPGINGGRPFPARFDNRHKINITMNWKMSEKWEMSAAWTGMSGNRFTLATQCWDDPMLSPWHYDMTLSDEVNNYRLPFYHRLDLSFQRKTRRGYWTFSAYNAYCNMNVIAVDRNYSDKDYIYGQTDYLKPVYRQIRLLPIIPSVSYTWIF